DPSLSKLAICARAEKRCRGNLHNCESTPRVFADARQTIRERYFLSAAYVCDRKHVALVLEAFSRHLLKRERTEVPVPDEDPTAVVIFVASLYAFAIVLLYVLARAWEQTLSTRSVKRRGS